jgi:hypothetical protein
MTTQDQILKQCDVLRLPALRREYLKRVASFCRHGVFGVARPTSYAGTRQGAQTPTVGSTAAINQKVAP